MLMRFDLKNEKAQPREEVRESEREGGREGKREWQSSRGPTRVDPEHTFPYLKVTAAAALLYDFIFRAGSPQSTTVAEAEADN